MSNGAKVATLTQSLVDSVSAILTERMDEANDLANDCDPFSRARGLVNWLHEYSANDQDFVSTVVSAAAVSDLFHTIKQSILADDEVEHEELALAMELLSKVIHRYSWLDKYKRFDPLVDPEEVLDLLGVWENDESWLGGNYPEGATVMPFANLVMLACILSGDESLHALFTQITMLVARIIVSAGGTDAAEQQFQNALKQYRVAERAVITAVIAANSSPKRTARRIAGDSSDLSVTIDSPSKALQESLKELSDLVGVPEVKAEVVKLTNFLKVRQQRIDAGLPVPKQSLHFVFTGNPGTGKTTVARIVSRILYGFEILETPTLIEADRSMLVGGYIGQTAIKTTEVIEKAIDGVLFIDEAYTLAKRDVANDFGQEAIDTFLKRMEDLRDRLVVIVAGYPAQMKEFLCTNPGLESRFTRFIHFDDYHVADLCLIFDRLSTANAYKLTQQAKANLAVIFNRAYAKRDDKFGNARFVRNLYEKTLGNHADRLANSSEAVTTETLSTIEAEDLPFNMVLGLNGPFDASESKWNAQCPGCKRTVGVGIAMIGNRLSCKCGAKWRCPWWNLRPETLAGLSGFKSFERPHDLVGYDAVLPMVQESDS